MFMYTMMCVDLKAANEFSFSAPVCCCFCWLLFVYFIIAFQLAFLSLTTIGFQNISNFVVIVKCNRFLHKSHAIEQLFIYLFISVVAECCYYLFSVEKCFFVCQLIVFRNYFSSVTLNFFFCVVFAKNDSIQTRRQFSTKRSKIVSRHLIWRQFYFFLRFILVRLNQ